MKKVFAFTLMELLLALLIMGVFSVVMFNNFKSTQSNMHGKLSSSKVYKVLEAVQQASDNIKIIETKKCPESVFMVNAAGTWEYTLLNASGVNATTAEVVSLYQDYLKFQQAPLNFCDYTSYCSDSNIKGGKLFNDVYIGFLAYGNSIANCPNYYMPDSSSAITGKGKCWGNLYIKLADKQSNDNTLGKDVFIFGLNERGISY